MSTLGGIQKQSVVVDSSVTAEDARWLSVAAPTTADSNKGTILVAEFAAPASYVKVYQLPKGKEYHEILFTTAGTKDTGNYDVSLMFRACNDFPPAFTADDWASLSSPVSGIVRLYLAEASNSAIPVIQTRAKYLLVYLHAVGAAPAVNMKVTIQSFNAYDKRVE